MRHFATAESGKSKGQCFTPAEVSRVIAQVRGIGPQTRQDETLSQQQRGAGQGGALDVLRQDVFLTIKEMASHAD